MFSKVSVALKKSILYELLALEALEKYQNVKMLPWLSNCIQFLYISFSVGKKTILIEKFGLEEKCLLAKTKTNKTVVLPWYFFIL